MTEQGIWILVLAIAVGLFLLIAIWALLLCEERGIQLARASESLTNTRATLATARADHEVELGLRREAEARHGDLIAKLCRAVDSKNALALMEEEKAAKKK